MCLDEALEAYPHCPSLPEEKVSPESTPLATVPFEGIEDISLLGTTPTDPFDLFPRQRTV
jgi:hypothetical protein